MRKGDGKIAQRTTTNNLNGDVYKWEVLEVTCECGITRDVPFTYPTGRKATTYAYSAICERCMEPYYSPTEQDVFDVFGEFEP